MAEFTDTRDAPLQPRLAGLPPLPTLQEVAEWAPGPHETCNWVLPGQLLAGSYPGGRSKPEHTRKLESLTRAGVNTFLCLQESSELQSRFTPYISVVEAIHKDCSEALASPEFFHAPMPDGSVASRRVMEAALATLVERLQAGRVVYVHCWGGHGRTGTVIVAFLAAVYGMTVEQGKDYFMAGHGQRLIQRGGGPGHWPHSRGQFEMAKSFESKGPEGPILSSERLPTLRDWSLETGWLSLPGRRPKSDCCCYC